MNFRFGLSLGASDLDQGLYGLASLASDGLKIILPFAIAWAFGERRYLTAAAGVALFATCVAYSVSAAIGFASVNRADTAADRVVTAERYADLRRERDDVQRALAQVASARLPTAIEADQISMRDNEVWRRTRQCTDVTRPDSERWCARYRALDGELAEARRRLELEARLSEVRAALNETAAAGGGRSEADPQVAVLSILFSTSEGEVRLGLAVLVTALVELGSSLGFFVSMSHLRRSEGGRSGASPPPPDTLRDDAERPERASSAPSDPIFTAWADERLVQEARASVAVAALYGDYRSFAEVRAARVMTLTAFETCLQTGASELRRIGGRMTALGVRLRGIDDVKRRWSV